LTVTVGKANVAVAVAGNVGVIVAVNAIVGVNVSVAVDVGADVAVIVEVAVNDTSVGVACCWVAGAQAATNNTSNKTSFNLI
jgi:hypothetical protein